MLRKNLNIQKSGNIAKIKYFLPSSSSNRQSNQIYCENNENPLTKIKQKIHKKYNSSYSSSKINSKRHSKCNIIKSNQELGLDSSCIKQQNEKVDNHDISFEIIGIRDASENQKQPLTQLNRELSKKNKKFNYPLTEKVEQKSKIKINQQKKSQRTHDQQKSHLSPVQIQNTVRQLSKSLRSKDNLEQMMKKMTSETQKRHFQKFLTELKYDQNYQNIISMFTIMYFYEHYTNKTK